MHRVLMPVPAAGPLGAMGTSAATTTASTNGGRHQSQRSRRVATSPRKAAASEPKQQSSNHNARTLTQPRLATLRSTNPQDVLARAQAIAQAQMQIQAQMQAQVLAQQQQQQQQEQQRRAAAAAVAAATRHSYSGHSSHRSSERTLHELHRHSESGPSGLSQSDRGSRQYHAPRPHPVEWRVAIDPKSKRPYYYHPVTRETTWKKPQEMVDKEKHEKAQFFVAMENNIRSKLRTGHWLRRDSQAANEGADPATDDLASSSTSTGSHRSSSSRPSASAPGTPAHMTQSLDGDFDDELVDSSNQDDDDDDDATTSKPTLFRTLSSYETPVVNETKRGHDSLGLFSRRMGTIPSPIQERARQGHIEVFGGSRSRVEETHSLSASSSAVSMTKSQPPSASSSPTRRRSNSTSTIYVRMGTMNAPDQDGTIRCVATVLRAHLVEADEHPIAHLDPRFDVFVQREPQDQLPSLGEIGAFIKHVFARAQMESECIIMSLIYVERLLKATSGHLQLRGRNWRSILFCSMVMASKVWDDLSMCNADFSRIYPELSLREINELEMAYLSAVEYKVRVSAVSYAKYYFHLRSMCAAMGMLEAFDESAPLNLDGARKMQVLSEEYQERSKLMPAPRRRSVTITATTIESLTSDRAKLPFTRSKASPAASLEQLVHMEVRGAGGSSLGMHRSPRP